MTRGSGAHLVLVGVMGAGKTSVGAACATRLDRPFVDVDDVVASLAGRSVAEIFRTVGEAEFRRLEREAVADVCASPTPLVIACGGGAVIDADSRRRLRAAGLVVWLRAAPDELARRVGSGEEAAERPLLARDRRQERRSPVDVLGGLLEARTPAYEAVADATVETDGRTVEQVADAVLAEVARCTA
jgi:shikimate kinase